MASGHRLKSNESESISTTLLRRSLLNLGETDICCNSSKIYRLNQENEVYSWKFVHILRCLEEGHNFVSYFHGDTHERDEKCV
jgi:hypothetical protein